MPVPTLILDNISHAYGAVQAVREVGLAVDAGEVVCLVGPSGCGKSTLLRVAAGLEARQVGTVTIDGRVVADGRTDVPPERRGVGLVFQDFALFPHLNVLGNVAFGLGELGQGERKRVAGSILERVGMAGFAAAYPHELSGGEQQRVALARALAPSPKVMLLDEPFSGLDTRLRDQVRDESLHILKDSDAATLIVTHDSDEAMFMADRIAVMRDGSLAQLGAPSDLYFSPRDAFVTEFFSEINRLDGVVADGRVMTPVGAVAAPDIADGTRVDVLIRPEAVRIADGQGGGADATAQVVAARLLGRTSLLHLAIGAGEEGGEGRLHLHARVPGQYLPAPGTEVALAIDRSLAFVFPANDAT